MCEIYGEKIKSVPKAIDKRLSVCFSTVIVLPFKTSLYREIEIEYHTRVATDKRVAATVVAAPIKMNVWSILNVFMYSDRIEPIDVYSGHFMQ